MKIGQFSPYDFAVPGGVNEHISNLHREFGKRGFDSKVIAPYSDAGSSLKYPNRLDASFIPMGKPIAVPSGGSIARVNLSPWIYRQVAHMIKKESFDVIHIHEPFASLITLGALAADIPSLVTRVATFHTYKGSHFYRVMANKILRRYASKLKGSIAVSESSRHFVEEFIPSDYKIIPNGIFVDEFKEAKPFSEFKDGKINILFLGRLEKRKGLQYLLSAYSDLKWDFPNIRLMIVGGGNMDAESHRIIGSRNPSDIVLTGEVSEHDKARYYRTADIFCAPATGQESFGIVLLEAMAAGAAIAASRIDGFSNVIQDDKNSMMFTPKKVESLREVLSQLITNPKLRHRLSRAARNDVGRYNWDTVASEVISYYHQLGAMTRSSGEFNGITA
jgi:phosphatidylinositol alpha-mannosyltransferase